VDRHEALHGLQFDDDAVLYHDVQPVTAVKPHRFIDHRQRNLTPKHQAILGKLMAEAFLVR